MTNKPTVILVNVAKVRDWFIATSDDLRELMATHSDFSKLVKELPEAIRLLYKVKGFDVVVREGETPGLHPAGQFRYVTEKTEKKAA